MNFEILPWAGAEGEHEGFPSLMRFRHLYDFNFIRFLLAAAALFFVQSAYAEDIVLETPSFLVQIDVRCAEGNVTCDDVIYTGTSRKTGKSISVKGRTMHSMCADGVTPCRFQGYTFDNGKINYTVFEDGTLVVMNGKKTLVSEKGEWK